MNRFPKDGEWIYRWVQNLQIGTEGHARGNQKKKKKMASDYERFCIPG